MDDLIVLIHSPLVGPGTWSLVAQYLEAEGFEVLVPALTDSGQTPPPYWQQHAGAVGEALASIPEGRSLVLAGHSGAGALLPVIARQAQGPIKGYIFVDAGLPHPGQSRLDEMEASVPDFAQELRQHLGSGGRFPNWNDEVLSEILPDETIRRQVLAEMQPRSLSFFEEVMPIVPGWPEAPGGYLLFTEGYRRFLEQARQAGWPSRTLQAGHFHMLVDPGAVGTALIELMKEMNH